MKISITSECVYVPDALPDTLPGAPGGDLLRPERLHEILGRRGLGTKEPATRLALAAVHHALGLPTGPLMEHPTWAAGTAVVAASNFGNADTVCRIAQSLDEGGLAKVSPLEAPNASSNIVATSVAIRFGFTGPNIMVCNGPTSGLDAARTGARLLRAGRAERVVVVGCEAADRSTSRLVPGLVSAAACVVLEADREGCPELAEFRHVSERPTAARGFDRETSAAAGVLETAIASATARSRALGATVWCGDDTAGFLTAMVYPPALGAIA